MNAPSPTYDPTCDRPRPRTLRSDLDALRSRVEAAVAANPITVTAAAVGIGFMIGTRLTRPALALVIHAAGRAAAASTASWLGEAIRETALAHLAPEDRRAANTTDPTTGETRS